MMRPKLELSDAQWRERLTPEEFDVLRCAGTERAFTGEYTDTETKGVYRCKACQHVLFESDTKFHSGCGWPSRATTGLAWDERRANPACVGVVADDGYRAVTGYDVGAGFVDVHRGQVAGAGTADAK